jgi:hypothetical protein
MTLAGALSQNHLNTNRETCRNGGPTSNIVSARVKPQPTSRGDHKVLTVAKANEGLR